MICPRCKNSQLHFLGIAKRTAASITSDELKKYNCSDIFCDLVIYYTQSDNKFFKAHRYDFCGYDLYWDKYLNCKIVNNYPYDYFIYFDNIPLDITKEQFKPIDEKFKKLMLLI